MRFSVCLFVFTLGHVRDSQRCVCRLTWLVKPISNECLHIFFFRSRSSLISASAVAVAALTSDGADNHPRGTSLLLIILDLASSTVVESISWPHILPQASLCRSSL
jgi:hypothetical protein